MTATNHYADKAVVKLAAYLRANLPTYLRATEIELELAANSLPDPEKVLEEFASNDSSSPLVEVFDQGGGWEDYQSRIWVTDCIVAVGYTGDADSEAGDTLMRHYVTAVVKALEASETLGGTVIEAVLTSYGLASGLADQSTIRHVRTFGVTVHTDER